MPGYFFRQEINGRSNRVKKMKFVLSLGLAAIVGVIAGCKEKVDTQTDPNGAVALKGAGATFPQPLYEKWIGSYQTAHPNVKISYNGIGSGGGIKQITSKEVDFGASDAPLSQKELDAARANGQDLLQIPMTLGAVVPIYNVAGVDASKPLVFSGPVLADLFSGKIKKWNDSRIAELNAGVNLPDADVKIVHRDDPSGTTYVFTEYLSKVSGDWKAAKASDKWPADSAAGKGNPRVAEIVKSTQNALGYVELNYAMMNKLAYASLKNKAGKVVQPSIASVSAAANLPQVPDDLSKMSLTDSDIADAYPISSTTFLLIPKEIGDGGKAKILLDYVNWSLTEGQKLSQQLFYSPLPEPVVKAAIAKIKTVTSGGKAVMQ